MHFRVISSTRPPSTDQNLPGSSLPPEFQWQYRQWLLEAERNEKDVVVPASPCTALALKKDAALMCSAVDDDNKLVPVQATRARKPKKRMCVAPKPQRATYISGSLKPSVSRLAEKEPRSASEPRSTKRARQQADDARLILPAIHSPTHSSQPPYHPSHCSTSAPLPRGDSREVSPSLAHHRRTSAIDLNADDRCSYSRTSIDTTTYTDLPSLVDPNTTRRRFLDVKPIADEATRGRLPAVGRDERQKDTTEMKKLVKTYHRLAQTHPRRPKWENENIYEHSGDLKARKGRRPQRAKGKMEASYSPDECPKRVTKLLGSLRDLRQEMHDVAATFEAVLAQGGLLAKSIFATTDAGSDGGVSLIGNSKKLKTKVQQIRQLQRISVGNPSGVAIGLGLKAHYAGVIIGTPGATLATADAEEDDPIERLAQSYGAPYFVIARIVEKYRSIDVNKDGTLSKLEIQAMTNSLPGAQTSEIKDIWKALDIDESGSVSLHEFILWFVKSYSHEWAGLTGEQVKNKFMGAIEKRIRDTTSKR